MWFDALFPDAKSVKQARQAAIVIFIFFPREESTRALERNGAEIGEN